MDAGDIGIIIGIVSLGVTIICALGSSKLNKLCTQIERVEVKLKGELSRINSEINLLRGQNTNNANYVNNANRDIKDKIDKLEEHIRYKLEDRIQTIVETAVETAIRKKGRQS